MKELYKVWKHHAAHLNKLHQRKEYTDQQNNKNNTKFKIGIIKNCAHHVFEPKYLLGYNVLKIINDSTLMLVTPNDK